MCIKQSQIIRAIAGATVLDGLIWASVYTVGKLMLKSSHFRGDAYDRCQII